MKAQICEDCLKDISIPEKIKYLRKELPYINVILKKKPMK